MQATGRGREPSARTAAARRTNCSQLIGQAPAHYRSSGVGVNETAFDEGPRDWTTVDTAELEDGKPTSGMAGGTPVLLLRHDGHLHALHNRCSHRGCELSAGQVEGESVTCRCHGSRFSLRDGSIERGPATAPQPVFGTRESGGGIEVRLAAA